jgi:hypothetical protein
MRNLAFRSSLVAAALGASMAVSGLAAASVETPSLTNGGVFAGYISHVSAKSIAATFVVPTINCSKAASPSNIEISITFGPKGGGEVGSSGGVTAECNNGKAAYIGLTYVDHKDVIDTVKISAGQKVTVTITVSAATCKVTIKSPGGSKSQTGKGFAANYGVVGVSLFPPIAGKFPKFTALAFSAVTVGGKSLGSVHPTGYKAEGANGKPLAVPTTISHGKNFTVHDKA